MTITKAEDFIELLLSKHSEDHQTARRVNASADVWHQVLVIAPEFKEWVLLNYHVPIEIIEILSRDKDDGVRMEVARKNKLPVEMLERLARDESADVRRTAAHNQKLSSKILEEMLADPDEYVRKAARWRLKIND